MNLTFSPAESRHTIVKKSYPKETYPTDGRPRVVRKKVDSSDLNADKDLTSIYREAAKSSDVLGHNACTSLGKERKSLLDPDKITPTTDQEALAASCEKIAGTAESIFSSTSSSTEIGNISSLESLAASNPSISPFSNNRRRNSETNSSTSLNRFHRERAKSLIEDINPKNLIDPIIDCALEKACSAPDILPNSKVHSPLHDDPVIVRPFTQKNLDFLVKLVENEFPMNFHDDERVLPNVGSDCINIVASLIPTLHIDENENLKRSLEPLLLNRKNKLRDSAFPILLKCLSEEVKTTNLSNFLRDETNTTKLLQIWVEKGLTPWFKKVYTPDIQREIETSSSWHEQDSLRLANTFIDNVTKYYSKEACPDIITLVQVLDQAIKEKLGYNEDVEQIMTSSRNSDPLSDIFKSHQNNQILSEQSLNLIYSFLFLRIFTPCLIIPENFGLSAYKGDPIESLKRAGKIAAFITGHANESLLIDPSANINLHKKFLLPLIKTLL